MEWNGVESSVGLSSFVEWSGVWCNVGSVVLCCDVFCSTVQYSAVQCSVDLCSTM